MTTTTTTTTLFSKRWTMLLLVGVFCLSWSTSISAWLSLPSTTTTFGRTKKRHHGQRGEIVIIHSRLAIYLQDDETNGGFNTTSRGRSGSIRPATNTSSAAATPGFGDIMSPSSDDADVLFRDGLVTSTTKNCSLSKMYGIHHPLDRMAVTANGNLQRLFSSYYDSPVTVVVDHSTPLLLSDAVSSTSCWERRVRLQVFEQTFCVADSVIQVHSLESCALVESGQVGLGQLFRHLNILPEFALQAAGPTAEGGGFWRNYTLTSTEVTCSISERFCPGVWALEPVPTVPTAPTAPTAPASIDTATSSNSNSNSNTTDTESQ
jgi:hypothetical protein